VSVRISLKRSILQPEASAGSTTNDIVTAGGMIAWVDLGMFFSSSAWQRRRNCAQRGTDPGIVGLDPGKARS